MLTGILFYLYKMESTAFPDCKKSKLFTKVVCVVSCCASFKTLFFVCVTHFSLLAYIKHAVSSRKTPTSLQHFPTLLIRLIFVPFCLVFHFLLFFLFLFVFFCKMNRDQPTIEHAKVNCVKTKLVPLFDFLYWITFEYIYILIYKI